MKKLRETRLEKHMSQQELARRSGVSQTMIGAIERGVSVPTVGILAKLAKALEVPLTQLVEDFDGGETSATVDQYLGGC